jgi:transposase-like protein
VMKKTTTERKKELLGFQVGVQESIKSAREPLVDVKIAD